MERNPEENVFHLSVKSMLDRIGKLIIELGPDFFGYDILDIKDEYSSTRQKLVLKKSRYDGTYTPMYDNYQFLGVSASLDMKSIVISQLIYNINYVQPDDPGGGIIVQKLYDYMIEYMREKNNNDDVYIKNFEVSEPNAGYVPSRRIQFNTNGFDISVEVMKNIFPDNEKKDVLEMLRLLMI